MAIAPVPTISFESIGAVSLDDMPRDGRILEAKVTAMLTETLARLAIDGKAVDVTTPRPLPVGATMTLKAERDGGQLRLVTQGPIRPAPERPANPGAAAMPDILIAPLRTLLAKVQAMALEAALAPRPPAEPPAPLSSAAAFAALAEQASASQRAADEAALSRTAAALPQSAASETGLPQGMRGAGGETASPQAAADKMAALPLGAAAEEAAAPAQPSPGQPPPAGHIPLPPLRDGKPGAPMAQHPPGPSAQAEPDAAAMRPVSDDALPSPPPGADDSMPQAVPVRPQPLRWEATLRRATIAASMPPQPPEGQAPAGPFDALQSMLADAGGLLPLDEAVTAPPRGEARLQEGLAIHHAAAGPDMPDPAALAAKIAAAAQDAAPDARKTALFGAPPPEIGQAQAAASDIAATQARGERAAVHLAFDLPVYFPGNPLPLRLEVTRDEEEGTEEDGEARPRVWTIRFAAQAGPLGMIHAAITQTGDQIGVRLWAERGETAALFKDSAPQLQASLEASNLKLDALQIAQGAPDEPASGQGPTRGGTV